MSFQSLGWGRSTPHRESQKFFPIISVEKTQKESEERTQRFVCPDRQSDTKGNQDSLKKGDTFVWVVRRRTRTLQFPFHTKTVLVRMSISDHSLHTRKYVYW